MAKPAAPAAPRRRSLSPALPAPLLLWALFCAALGLGVAAHLHRASVAVDEGIHARAESVVAVAEHTLLRTFEAVQGVHDLLQLRQGLIEAEEAPGAHAIQTHIKGSVARGRFGIVHVGVSDRYGTGTWGTGEGSAGMSVADRRYFKAHLDGAPDGLFVSEPMLGRSTGRWGIQVSRPVRDIWGGLVGVGLVSLDPVALSRGLGRDLDAGQTVVVRHLSDGTVLARSRDIEARLGRPGSPDHATVAAARRARSARIVYLATDGRRLIGAYRVPEGLPLVVTAVFDRAAERAQFRRAAVATALAALAVGALALQAALWWARARRDRQRLQVEAERDPLTGLLNRRALQAQAARLFAEAEASGRSLALLLLDLDHFKAINDTHGHAAGDAVLRGVAEVLGREIRHDDLACRWGGEEMLAILKDCDLVRAEERAVQLRAAIAAARFGAVPGLRVTASIGVSAFPEHGAGLDELTERADLALYTAKRYGRDRVVCALAA